MFHALCSVVTHRREQYSPFQEVFARLEDADSLEGLTMLRKGGPTVHDRLASAHNTGRWAEALAMHQQLQRQAAPQHPPTSTRKRPRPFTAERADGQHAAAARRALDAAQHGALTCMMHMGHWDAVCSMVDGVCLRASLSSQTCDSTAAWAPYGAAACWRLGEWGRLDEYLTTQVPGRAVDRAPEPMPGFDAGWEVDLGRLLLAVARCDHIGLSRLLARARDDTMRALMASSMESYSRAYPQLAKLHVLQEVADAAAILRAGGGRQQLRGLQWIQRLKCTQPSLVVQVLGIGCCFFLLCTISRRSR